MTEKNPTIIPGASIGKRGCPKCGHDTFSGRNIGGVVSYTCAKCRNQWHGGIGQVPEDPTVPKPPTNPADRPTVTFVRNKQGEVVEQRRPVSTVQTFRKGLPIPGDDT